MNRGIQGLLIEETEVNSNRSSDLSGVLTCPLPMIAMRTNSLLASGEWKTGVNPQPPQNNAITRYCYHFLCVKFLGNLH